MNIPALAYEFLEKLDSTLQQNKVELEPDWQMDHICYRVSSQENYNSMKLEFNKISTLLIESLVNGRLIATYKLNKAINYKNWNVEVIELPSPKPGKITIEGFEHAEFVTDLPFSELKKRFRHIKLDESGLAKKINPELELCLGEINIKFHHQTLESVIELEKQSI